MQATAAGIAHAIIIWWQLNLDPSGLITLDTAPCWVASPAPDTAPQGPHTTPQLVAAPDAAPLHGSSTAEQAHMTARAVELQDAAPSRRHTHAASLGVYSCRQEPLAESAQAALAASVATRDAVSEGCPSLEQGQQQQQQQQQHWRDHWKQCWAPVQPHFRLGKLQATWEFVLIQIQNLQHKVRGYFWHFAHCRLNLQYPKL